MRFEDFFGSCEGPGCDSEAEKMPPKEYRPTEGSSASLGTIRWSQKLKGDTNYSPAQDTDIRLEDSKISVIEEGESHYSMKVMKLSEKFLISVAYGDDPKKGFGLMLQAGEAPIFSWDWFYFKEGQTEVASKLQEGGKLHVTLAEVEGKTEITHLRFDTDISIRGYEVGISTVFKIFTGGADSRVLIKRGSEIHVPVLHDGNVVLLISGA